MQRLTPTERTQLIVTGLASVAFLASSPFLGLTPDETRALFAILFAGALFSAAMLYARARFGAARLAPIAVLFSALLVTCGFALLSRVSPGFWVLYLILPFGAMLLYGAHWPYIAGLLAILSDLVVLTLNRMGGIEVTEAALELTALAIVTLLCGKLSAARASLRESEERFRLLSDASMEAISIHDENRILDANSTLARALGYDLAELIGMNPMDLAAPESRALIRQNILSGNEQPYEAQALRKDGTTFPVEVTGRDIHYQGRRVRVAALRDLTERRRAEMETARLLEQEKQRAAELEAVRQATLSLTAQLDLPIVLDTILETTHRLVREVRDTHIFLYDDARLTFGAALWMDGRKGQPVAEPRPGGLTYSVATTGQPIFVSDLRDHPLFANRPSHWLGAIAGLPLKIGERVVGVMNIAYHQPHVFSENEMRLVHLLADQAAIAIENARLFQVAEAERRRLQLLYEIDRELSATLDPRAILERAIRLTTQSLGAMMGEGWLFAPETQRLHLFALAGRPHLDVQQLDAQLNLVVGQGLAGWVAQQRTPTLLDDIARDPHWLPTPGLDDDVRSVLSVPILTGGELLGVLTVAAATPNAFGSEHLDLLTALSQQVAIALTNARLYSETRRRADEFAALYETTLDLAQHQDQAALLQIVVERATTLLAASEGFIYLYTPARGELELAVSHSAHLLPGTRLKLGEGMAGQVAQSRKPLIVDNYRAWEHRAAHLSGIPFSAVAEVPMIYGGELVGVLGVNEVGDTTRCFTESDIRLLVLFAAQAASAVHNARLYINVQQRLKELGTLHQASLAFSQLLTPAAVGKRVIEEIEQLMGYQRGSIWTLDETGQALGLLAHSDIGLPSDAAQAEAARVRTLGVQLGKGITGWVALHGQSVRAGDVKTNPHYIEADPTTQSELSVPLLIGGRAIGAINVESPQPNAFSEHDERLMTTLASQAAIAIDNARLFQAQQARGEELGALYDLSRTLADTAGFDAILAHVTQHAVKTVHITVARVALLDGAEFVLRAAHPTRFLEHDLELGRRESMAAHPYCVQILQQNMPVVLHADDPALGPAERETLFLNFLQTLCLVPLCVGERALGFLLLGEARHAEREPFTAEKIRLARSIGDQAASALRRAELYAELEHTYLQTVLALANAVEAKDTYTAGHAERLAEMALEIGRALEMTPHELEDLRYGAILHDIGKIGVPDAILQKPAQLDPVEWNHMRRHPEIGAQILAPVQRLAGAAKIIRHHHERYDGGGYPAGLAGNAIPLGARILTVVDSYSAITDVRVYKPARSRADAVTELEKHAGTQFDPQIVELFLRLPENDLAAELPST